MASVAAELAMSTREREVLRRRVKTLERALDRALKMVTQVSEEKLELEACLFEERTKSAQRVETARTQCAADAVEVAVKVVKGLENLALPSSAAYAERLVANFGEEVCEDDGDRLKETLVCVFHSHGQAPPISPTEALPAALACVDFAARVAPALISSKEMDQNAPFFRDVVSRVKTNLQDVIARRGRSDPALLDLRQKRNPFRGAAQQKEDDLQPPVSATAAADHTTTSSPYSEV